MVTEEENGSLGSKGSDSVGVIRGKNAAIAATPPIRVATPKTTASGEIPPLFFFAFFGAFDLGNFGALLDIASLSLKV